MALTVNTNVSALNARRHTNDSQLDMAVAMERLASGKRINSARDDAAGLAIAGRMEAQISGLNQAVRNSADAISLVQTAEGALQEYGEILQRIRELSIQSAGGAPSNSDRVNLHKEVEQLQAELGRIANTTRFNGGLLLNGTFLDQDFQIGASNQEEIQVSIEDLRPETIGAWTQTSLSNVGMVLGAATKTNVFSATSAGATLVNGVVAQTITVGVGEETPRTVAIGAGASARDIADALNQSGAMVNSRATTTIDVYFTGTDADSEAFTFELSNSANPELTSTVSVGSGSSNRYEAMAASINASYSSHNISATVGYAADGTTATHVALYQANGYDIIVDEYTAGSTDMELDFGGYDEFVLNGTAGASAIVVGGSIILDAPESTLLTTTDTTNSVLVGTRASLEFPEVDTTVANWNGETFNLIVGTTDGEEYIQLTITGATEFTDVVTQINTQLAAAKTAGTLSVTVAATYTTGSDTLSFAITDGVSNSDSTLTITEAAVTIDDTVDEDGDGTLNDEVALGAVATSGILATLNMTESLTTSVTNIGGGTSPTEEVRYVSEIDISTHASALLAMTVVDAALETVAANRATLGAVANRLESTIQNLMTTSENTAASLSRVMDADYAAESSALARAQVLQQASIAILAQANATAQQVLRLLE